MIKSLWNHFLTLIQSQSDAILLGVIIGVFSALSWAIIASIYTFFAERHLQKTIFKSLNISSYVGIHGPCAIFLKNTTSCPITVHRMALVCNHGAVTYYLPELREYQAKQESMSRILNIGELSRWVFEDIQGDVNSCYLHVEFPSRLRNRNFAKYPLTGKHLAEIRQYLRKVPSNNTH